MTEPTIPTSNPYPTLGQAWILFLIYVGLNIGAGAIAIPFQNWAPALGFFLAYVVGMGATYYLARRMAPLGAGPIVHSFQAGNLVVYPILLVLTWTSLLFITPIIELYPPPEWFEEIFEGLMGDSQFWSFMTLVVAAPIFEELLFRGIILDGFLKRYSVWKSILWSSFFFGLFHLNPWQFVTAMILGSFIGWVYHRTRSLLPCMAIHAFANGTSFLMGQTMDEEQMDMTLLETVGGIGPLLLALVVGAVIFWMGIRILDRLLPAAPPMNVIEAPVETGDDTTIS
ncbi:MAG: CPBP family glutamic-type intramembrane protease [Saprospiraceae bacterium]|nr:CPBP family intramembrane metalloprotease [Lewinella sp.]